MQNNDYFCQFGWILKVLDSCEKPEQVETSVKLFSLYLKRWETVMSNKEIRLFKEHFEKNLKSKTFKKKKEGFLSKYSQFFLL